MSAVTDLTEGAPMPIAASNDASAPFGPVGVAGTEPETQTSLRARLRLVTPDPGEHLNVGERLAQARTQMGASLEQMAARTKINAGHLTAIEQMDVSAMPDAAVLIGFVRTYAGELRLDANAIVAQFRNECARARRGDEIEEIAPNEAVSTRHRIGEIAGWTVMGIVAFGIGVLGWRLVSAKPIVQRAATENLSVASSANGTSWIAAPVVETAKALATNTGTPSDPVRLVVAQPTWMEVRGPDGTIYFKRYVRPGEFYEPQLGSQWTVSLGNGAAVQVEIGGRTIRTIGAGDAPVLGLPVDTLAR